MSLNADALPQLFSPVFEDVSIDGYTVRSEDFMVINQKGLNRKVRGRFAR